MENLEYTLIRSDRKSVSLEIKPDLTLIVRAPRNISKAEIEKLLSKKSDWIANAMIRLKAKQAAPREPKLSDDEIDRLRELARQDLINRVNRFAPVLGVSCGRVSIRRQKTRWGSCSSKGNISFNLLLELCPEKVRDYVVVHELCHIIHMNHSKLFWECVESVLPDYRESRSWLKYNGEKIMSRAH